MQVHKAATLLPGPSTVVLLPLSDVHKSLSEPATHVVPIFTKTRAHFDGVSEQDAVAEGNKTYYYTTH